MIPFIVEDVMLSRSPTRGENVTRPEQNAAFNTGIMLVLRTTIKKMTSVLI